MRISFKRYQSSFPLYILLATACLKWLFEGVLGQPLLEVVVLFIGLSVLAAKSGIQINKISAVWILYSINLLLSVLFHDPSIGRIGRAFVMIEITCFMIFEKYDQEKYPKVYDFMIKLAFFYGFFVLVQLLWKGRFNAVYFPMLIENYEYVANHYSQQGYYFGLIFNPHEIAYLLSASFVALVLWQIIVKKVSIVRCVGCVILFVLMLLTQKKGVIALSLVSLFLVICVLYATRKQWIRIVGLVIIVGIGCVAMFFYIKSHSDSVLFYRIVQFFEKLSNNQSIDSGRSQLHQFAINEFMNHKWFGIGWRKFNSLTTTVFGYQSGHEVNFDYLQWLCETGIVGFTLNIIPVLTMLRRTILVCRKYVRNEQNVRVKWSVLIAIFSQFFTVVYAFIEIPFYDILVFAIYIISCIVINAAYQSYCRQNSVRVRYTLRGIL